MRSVKTARSNFHYNLVSLPFPFYWAVLIFSFTKSLIQLLTNHAEIIITLVQITSRNTIREAIATDTIYAPFA